MYDFDRIINRRNTHCEKWDGMEHLFGSSDLLPLWVADMDFAVAPEILGAVKKSLDHAVFGYPIMHQEAKQAVCDWQKKQHQWEISQESLTFVPGVLVGLITAIKALSKPGAAVMIQPPVYAPFFSIVTENGRTIKTNPLVESADGYSINYRQLEEALTPDVKFFLLCNPHNPVGRVWQKEELEAIVAICARHNTLILSDEIHQDLVYSGSKHTPIASISEEAANRTITLIAPSKTFNIPGLKASVAVIPNADLRARFQKEASQAHINGINQVGLIALEAAYKEGGAWHSELLSYLEKNRDFITHFIKKRMPRVKIHSPQGTYLCWLDFREYGLESSEIQKRLVEKAGVALNSGRSFGAEGEGFVRLNFGCPLSVLLEGLTRIAAAFE